MKKNYYKVDTEEETNLLKNYDTLIPKLSMLDVGSIMEMPNKRVVQARIDTDYSLEKKNNIYLCEKCCFIKIKQSLPKITCSTMEKRQISKWDKDKVFRNECPFIKSCLSRYRKDRQSVYFHLLDITLK